MAYQALYVADEQTPLITAEAFGVRLRQSGFAVQSQTVEGDEAELTLDGVVLWLFVENGFVAEVEAEVTLADDRRANRLLELIESMGWAPAEEE
jgi:hypothetical protein